MIQFKTYQQLYKINKKFAHFESFGSIFTFLFLLSFFSVHFFSFSLIFSSFFLSCNAAAAYDKTHQQLNNDDKGPNYFTYSPVIKPKGAWLLVLHAHIYVKKNNSPLFVPFKKICKK